MKIRHIHPTLAGVIGGATLVAVSLSAEETPSPKPPVCIYQTLEQVDAEFKQRDSDGNGVLSLAEFTAQVPQDPSGATHRFRIVDLDRNDQLSSAEFRAAVRFEVPDPWNDLATAARDKVLTIIRAADQDADGALTRKEWPGAELHAQIRPFGEIDFVKWDANSDGRLVEAEIRQLVNFAYGLTLQTGEPARWPNGTLLDWTYLKHLDQNGDHRISRAEFTARHVESREQNEKLFEELNTSRDDHLSFAEISASPDIARKHPIGVFTNLDKNADGLLSFEEITVDMPPAQVQGRTLTLLLAAFDENGDKQLNFVEFQRSPLGIRPLIANLLNRKDRNQDGLVSWTEFHAVPQPQFAGIAWEIFQRFDQDHDLQLFPDEYDFPLARENAQANQQEAQWQPYARQILRAELHYFLSICPLNAEQRQTLKPVVEQLLPRTVRQLVADQQPRARGANAVRDPRAMITEQFSQFAREHLPADTAAEYQQENALRLKQRQQATVLNLVARLDRELRLSEDQRQKIAVALQEHWQPAWEQQMELQAQNLHLMVPLPNDCVSPHLREDQRSVWIARTHANSSRGMNVRMGGNVVGRIVMAQGNQFVIIDGRAVPVENDDADLADLLPAPAIPPAREGAVLIEEIRVDK